MTLLKRTTDIVFKLLFVQDPESLKYMLSVILGDEIEELTILNPEIPGRISRKRAERLIVLDVRVQLRDGRRVIVEMQMRADQHLPRRLAFYVARDLSSGLKKGESYADLGPTVLIVWLNERLFPRNPQQLHRIAELRLRDTGELLTDALAIHVLQLDDFEGPSPPDEAPGRSALRRWARFLGTNSEAELKRIAHEDPKMRRAIETIQTLSKDPKAQRLAQAREEAAFFYRADINAAKGEGKAELLAALLKAKFGVVDPAIMGRVREATETQLETWALRVLSASTLAEVFAD